MAEKLQIPRHRHPRLISKQSSRTNRGIEISLAFRNGRIQHRDPGAERKLGRTYVEAL
jgi:hypothetical protein